MNDKYERINPLYMQLYKSQMEASGISRRDIALKCALSHSTVNNFLRRKTTPTYSTLIQIGEALAIRRIEAFIAVEVLNDISTYNHPGMKVFISLLQPLGASLAGDESPIRDDFNGKDIDAFQKHMLAKVAETIASRERAINNFRNTNLNRIT